MRRFHGQVYAAGRHEPLPVYQELQMRDGRAFAMGVHDFLMRG